MTKRILVLAGNPKPKGFSNYLAEVYAKAAEPDFEVRLVRLSEMQFDPNLSLGYDDEHPLEQVLLSFQESLLWADHLVIFTPIWWGSLPAKLKGLIDRTFLPNFAFEYTSGKSTQTKLLKNKTSRVFMTMDAPPWYYKLFQGAPAVKQLKTATLKFCGFKSVKTNMYGPIINSKDKAKDKWIKQVVKLGEQAK